ncbi:hypothetical protein SERLA73DRAFT_53026, partial [Serpula lacrymans var. lacrymans S7.3]
LQHVVAGLMLWSNATQLTYSSSSKLWPLYVHFANESKYYCTKPSCNLCHYAAYF